MTYSKFTQEEIASWPPEHKKCRGCHEVLAFDKFNKASQCLFGLDTKCKDCRKPASKKQWDNETFEVTMLRRAKWRAKEKGLDFGLTLPDINIPEICPILDVPIVKVRGHMYRPSLDRIIPHLGYVPDNIRVVSYRGNMLKSNTNVIESVRVLSDQMRTMSETIHNSEVMKSLRAIEEAMKPHMEKMHSVSVQVKAATANLDVTSK